MEGGARERVPKIRSIVVLCFGCGEGASVIDDCLWFEPWRTAVCTTTKKTEKCMHLCSHAFQIFVNYVKQCKHFSCLIIFIKSFFSLNLTFVVT